MEIQCSRILLSSLRFSVSRLLTLSRRRCWRV
ncbi:LOW QUALITY PROTEIN: KRT8 isoform 4 [Pongo abelii]|uniref:KRT8 isoform 4 n=1 Tax=Pongo abelii TaxID=9601 RepID=A0A2J8SXG1_PONAB|nr:LOW QUALITY PROTEIN: KRT8 isoform 4 [Pongo abelii]